MGSPGAALVIGRRQTHHHHRAPQGAQQPTTEDNMRTVNVEDWQHAHVLDNATWDQDALSKIEELAASLERLKGTLKRAREDGPLTGEREGLTFREVSELLSLDSWGKSGAFCDPLTAAFDAARVFGHLRGSK